KVLDFSFLICTKHISAFLDVAAFIEKAAPTGLTVTQKKALAAVASKLSGSDPVDYAGVKTALTKTRAARKTKAKKPALDGEALSKIVSELTQAAKNRSVFEAKVDALNKAHSAPELKKITSAFAAGARPKTKADAMRILKAERNDRDRAAEKAEEAGRARPW
ncbi:MAG: hypothetical protein AAGK93_10545, partial [Pseudomonadota bacterium]